MQVSFECAYLEYLKYIDNKQKLQSKRSIEDKFKNHILPYFKDFDIYKISCSDYIDFQNRIDSFNLSYNTKKNIHFMLSSFFNYLVIFYNVDSNIVRTVGCFNNKSINKVDHDFYTYKEFRKFIKYVDNDIYKSFFMTMYFTGARPGETMALKFSDLTKYNISINKTIDEHGDRNISTPKTLSSYRNINIDKKLYNDLIKLKEKYINIYEDPDYDYFIFGGKKPLSPTTINRRKLESCNRANIRPIKLHEFRHSHASLLMNSGILIHDISSRLGHSNVSTTLNIYTHSFDKNKKRVRLTLSLLRLFL